VFGRGLHARPTALFAVGDGSVFFKCARQRRRRIAGNQHIMGGNLASNFAGEFSFTLALAWLFFLGALAYSLERRRRMWLPPSSLPPSW
jgi:hypothetical protein